jgi:hypothetical protein
MKSREQDEEKIASDLFKTRLSLRIEKGLSCGKTRWADKSIEQEFALWMIQIFDQLDWVLCLFTGNQEALLQLLKAHTHFFRCMVQLRQDLCHFTFSELTKKIL